MNLIEASVANPVKVAVGVLLVTLFGSLALVTMPIQLTPEVQIPTISVEARWLGASPQEIEREIVQPLEEQLRTVEGLVKLSSDSADSKGTVELEFAIGTNMDQALVKTNTRIQQVRDWPIDADRPVIRTASTNDRPIAWLILGQAVPEPAALEKAKVDHPALAAELDRVLAARTPDLALNRIGSWRHTPSSIRLSRPTSTSRRCGAWRKTTSRAGSSGSTASRPRISSAAGAMSCR